MMIEQAATITEYTKQFLLPVNSWRVNTHLFACAHIDLCQVRAQMKFQLILIPQFIISVTG
jgi:hypothetical protein